LPLLSANEEIDERKVQPVATSAVSDPKSSAAPT
jgi:hypothetical protein